MPPLLTGDGSAEAPLAIARLGAESPIRRYPTLHWPLSAPSTSHAVKHGEENTRLPCRAEEESRSAGRLHERSAYSVPSIPLSNFSRPNRTRYFQINRKIFRTLRGGFSLLPGKAVGENERSDYRSDVFLLLFLPSTPTLAMQTERRGDAGPVRVVIGGETRRPLFQGLQRLGSVNFSTGAAGRFLRSARSS